MRNIILVVSVLLFLSSSVYADGGYVLLDETAAIVGNKVILRSEFQEYLCYRAMKRGVDPETLDRVEILNDLIDEKLVVEEAAKMGIVPNSREKFDERAREIKNLLRNCPGQCSHLCEDELFPAKRALTEIAIEEFIDKRIKLFITISDRDIMEYYVKRKDAYGETFDDEVRKKVEADLRGYLVRREYEKIVAKLRSRVRIVLSEE